MWWRTLLGIIIFLIYLRSPIDLIPDFLRPFGFLDDIGAAFVLWWYLNKKSRELQQSGGSSDEGFEEILEEEIKQDTKKSPYEILGVSISASKEEIEAAYKNLMKQYHPDRVHGLGPELLEVARKKSQAINAAYQALKK